MRRTVEVNRYDNLVSLNMLLTLLRCQPTHTLYFDKMPMNDDHNGSVLLDQGEQPVADLATK